MRRFYKLKYDTMAKLVFSDKEILGWFLNRLLGINVYGIKVKDRNNGRVITERYLINLIDKELSRGNVLGKSKVVDMLVETGGYLIDLEFNSKFGNEEKKKSYSYVCSLYSNSVFSGKRYSSGKNVIQVNLCFDLNDYSNDVYNVVGGIKHDKLVDNLDIYVYI